VDGFELFVEAVSAALCAGPSDKDALADNLGCALEDVLAVPAELLHPVKSNGAIRSAQKVRLICLISLFPLLIRTVEANVKDHAISQKLVFFLSFFI
jgi:hypothetical protein